MSSTWSPVNFGATAKKDRAAGGERGGFLSQRSGSVSNVQKRLPKEFAALVGAASVIRGLAEKRHLTKRRTVSVADAAEAAARGKEDSPSSQKKVKDKSKVKKTKSKEISETRNGEKPDKNEKKDKKKSRKTIRDFLKIKDKDKTTYDVDYFIEFLRSSNFDKDKEELTLLCTQIKESGEPWISDFVEAGGVNELFSLLQPASACKDIYVAELYFEALKCLETLSLFREASSALLCPDNLVHVILLMLQPNSQVVGHSAMLLDAVSQLDSGFAMVAKALEIVNNATGERGLFHPFSAGLLLDPEEPVHKAEVLTAINTVLSAFETPTERWKIHVELLEGQIHSAISILYSMDSELAHNALRNYEILLTDDFHAVSKEASISPLLIEIDPDPTNLPESYFSVEFRLVSLTGAVVVPIEEEALVSDIFDILVARQAYLTDRFATESFGLFFPVEDEWAELSRPIGSYGFLGETPAEFRLKPWTLAIQTVNGERTFNNVDPHDLVDDFLERLIIDTSADTCEEWGLLWEEKDIWLDAALRICEYDLYVRKQEATLKFMQAPMKVHVQFRGRSLEFVANALMTAADFIKEVVGKMNIPADQHSEYCLFENIEANLQDPTAGIVEDEMLMVDARRAFSGLNDFTLQLRVKPQAVNVIPPATEEDETPEPVKMRLLFKKPMGDSHDIICRWFALEPEQYHLYWKTETGEVKGLFRWSSLKDQGVPYGCDLVLMKKAYTDIDEIIDDDEDDNIWDEEMTEETLKTEMEGGKEIVLCGSLNRLVRLLTNEEKFDSTFLNTFLLTYRSMTTPDKLLKKLLERYDVSDEVSEKNADIIKMRVCVVLKRWVERFNDEKETQLIGELSDFIDGEIDTGPAVVANVRKALMKVKRDGRILQAYQYSEPPPPPKLPKSLTSFTFIDIPPLELARQLCIRSFNNFQAVKPFEFFNQVWSKPKYQHLCPNVMNMIGDFNDVSNWVGSALVMEETVRARAKVMEHFILIAKHLRELNNYHLLQAVISGLNSSSILRLKFTRARLSKRVQAIAAELEALTNMENSYKAYRTALSSSDPPLIPYFGVYLADLTFIEDGNPDTIDGLIHFAKRALVYKLLSQVTTYQVKGYNLETVPELQMFLSDLPILDEKEMYSLSLEREPRSATRADIL